MPLTKFGLLKYDERKEFENYASDTVYAWDLKFGQNRTQAFKTIINIVTYIAVASIAGNWQAIKDINVYAVAKGKSPFIVK